MTVLWINHFFWKGVMVTHIVICPCFFFEFKDWYETLRSIDVKCEVQIKFSKTVALQHHFVSF